MPTAPADATATAPERLHWAMRCFAALGAVFAAAAIALMAAATVQNWGSLPDDHAPWLSLAMLAAMLALLWSGLTLVRRYSVPAFVVFTTSALMGIPFALIGLAVALSD